MMDREMIVKQVFKYFSQPNAQLAKSSTGICFYRTDPTTTSRACAIGCLIPDDLYQESMEGVGASDMIRNHPEVAEFFGDPGLSDLDFLDDLQGLHDGSQNVRTFLTELIEWAAAEGWELP